ncbi:MAG: nitroreductase family protein [Defluviitaleaceae bacterium]|nr:nitroreductase family protein [Defluviitaleaceae bacterium]
MNDVLKTIQERFSCRGYTGELLDKEILNTIGRAALQAPSSKNTQHWQIIAIQNKELLDEMNDAALDHIKMHEADAYERILSRGGKVFYNSACMFLILTPPDAHEDVRLDVGIVAQNIALAAQSLGLGNVIAAMSQFPFINAAKGEELKKRVGWKEGYNFGVGVLLGHGNNTKDPHEIDLNKFTIVE